MTAKKKLNLYLLERRRLNHCPAFIITLIVFIFFAEISLAGESVLLATGEWAPYTTQNFKGKGFISEIVVDTLKMIRKKGVVNFYPWKRCEARVKNNLSWGCFPYAYTEERATIFAYSDLLGTSTTKLFYYKPNGTKYTFKKFNDLKNYILSGVLGYFYVSAFDKQGFRVVYSADEVQAIEKVITRPGPDLVPLNELVGWHLINQHFPDKKENFATLETPFLLPGDRDSQRISNELKLMVNKNNKKAMALLHEFNSALADFKKTEEYKNILKKFGLTP